MVCRRNIEERWRDEFTILPERGGAEHRVHAVPRVPVRVDVSRVLH